MAAVTAPAFLSFLDAQRAKDTASTLSSLSLGIGAFRTSVLNYPQKLSQLTNPITIAQLNSCGAGSAAQVFTAANVTAWNTNAPFVTFYTPSTVSGVSTPMGNVTDLMIRNPVGPGGTLNGTLAIRIQGLDTADARELDFVIDGASGVATGVLTYTVTAGVATASYLVPVGNRC